MCVDNLFNKKTALRNERGFLLGNLKIERTHLNIIQMPHNASVSTDQMKMNITIVMRENTFMLSRIEANELHIDI
mgnify:CR=1 FL=1